MSSTGSRTPSLSPSLDGNDSPQSPQNNHNSNSTTKRYPARTLMRLQYSPPPNNHTDNTDNTDNNNNNNNNMWREKAVSPDFQVIQQQIKKFQNMNQAQQQKMRQ